MLTLLPCLDSPELADARRRELQIPRSVAAELDRSAVEAAERGCYTDASGRTVDWSREVRAALSGKRSLPPDEALPPPAPASFPETRIQVTNETTLGASRRLLERGLAPLALNFANGVNPGGGFLHDAPCAGGGAVPVQRAPCDARGRPHVCGAPAASAARLDGLVHPFPGRARLPHGRGDALGPTLAAGHPHLCRPLRARHRPVRLGSPVAKAHSPGAGGRESPRLHRLGPRGMGLRRFRQRCPPHGGGFPGGSGEWIRRRFLRHRLRHHRLVAGATVPRPLPRGVFRHLRLIIIGCIVQAQLELWRLI